MQDRFVIVLQCLVLIVALYAPTMLFAQAHPEGVFVGLEPLGGATAEPDANGRMWYRENIVIIRGDSLFLEKTLLCYEQGQRLKVQSTTTSSSYVGRLVSDTAYIRAVRCETCERELRQNPDTGVYEEVPVEKKAHIRFEQDMVYIDGIVHMKRG